MKFKHILLLCAVFVAFFFHGSLPTASAQNRSVTPEMINQAMNSNYGNVAADEIQRYREQNNSETPETPTTYTANDRTRTEEDTLTYEGEGFDEEEYLYNRQNARGEQTIDLENTVFGREIFSSQNLSFAPSFNIATPPNYILSTGDRLFIDVWGTAQANYDVKISPDGFINLPRTGLIQVAGQTVEQAESRIRSKMSESISGLRDGTVQMKLTLGDIGSIKVNIIGEASVPGTYMLPTLATLFNALYSAGGVNDIGSLRNIKLVRGGKQIATLDVYEYLIGGKQSVNVGLQDNDLIVVQPYDNLVKISGKVKRPRIFELKKNETASQLLEYAGGFMGGAYKEYLTVYRKSGRQQTIHTVGEDEFRQFTMTDGDEVLVGDVIPQFANRVTIQGAVWRPGDYELNKSLTTLKELIQKAEGIRGDALQSRTQIVRLKNDYTFEILSVELNALLNDRIPDITLHPEDLVRIPSINTLREEFFIEVRGEVNNPGVKIYGDNMSLEDAILMADGLKESASLKRIEIARRVKNPNSIEPSERIAELYEFDIRGDFGISPEGAGFKLHPFDVINIRRSPGYNEQQIVTAEGQFIFNGEYVLSQNNERLSDLVSKAGGLTTEAYVKGAFLKRQLTEDRYQIEANLQELAERGTAATGDTILNHRYKVGDYYIVAVDLPTALSDPESEQNLILQEGDRLIVPKQENTVTVRGAVLYPSTVPYEKGRNISHYIARGGGYADKAKKRPFIIYANGQPAAKNKGRWPTVEPGCIIVVPQKSLKPNRMGPAEIMSLTSSTVSMGAVITSLINTLSN